MTALTTAQLDELERSARGELSAFIPLSLPIAPEHVLRLVAIARAALAWSELKCDPESSISSGCNGWFHTGACQERHSEAQRAMRDALRGAP